MSEALERSAVVKAARRWLATPYEHHANVLGAGIDCAHFLVEAFAGAGLAERFEVEPYNHDWHMHRNEERYLAKVEAYFKRIDTVDLALKDRPEGFSVKPGNVIVWRHGRTFSHGAIVTDWPNLIHASFPARSVVEESIEGGMMAEKIMRVYSFWGS